MHHAVFQWNFRGMSYLAAAQASSPVGRSRMVLLAAFGGANPQVLAYCAMFLITGVVTTCANQLLFYQGAGGTPKPSELCLLAALRPDPPPFRALPQRRGAC